jgi:hypothetical protein
MHQHAEKRNFLRMSLDCPARFRIAGSANLSAAIVKNLSSSGMLILSEQELDPGTQLAIEIMPGKTITPPLSAQARVVRSHATETGDYNIACSIDRILPEHEVGPDFP